MATPPPITITTSPTPGHDAPGHGWTPVKYRVAGAELLCDRALACLEPFRSDEKPPGSGTGALAPDDAGTRLEYDGRVSIGGRLVRVLSRSGPGGYRLDIAGSGRFFVSRAGDRIVRLEGAPPATAAEVEAALLGPCLCLALALRARFCLHASAIARDGHVVLFLGESGAGKSTLANWLGEAPGGFAAAADDLLPVALDERAATAWPRYPQPKWHPDRQWRGAEALPIAAIYELEPATESSLQVTPLRGQEAAVALLRQTVAARLFGPELKRRQLELASALALRVPLYRLRTARGRRWLPRLIAALRADVEAAAAAPPESRRHGSRSLS